MSNDNNERLSDMKKREGETSEEFSDRVARVINSMSEEERQARYALYGKRSREHGLQELEAAREIELSIKKLLGLNPTLDYHDNYIGSSTNIVSIEH